MRLFDRRRALTAMSGEQSGLPSEYQQVEYIVNGNAEGIDYGGQAYLDLDMSVTNEDIIRVEFRPVLYNLQGGKNLLGGRSSATSNNIELIYEDYWYLDYGSYAINRVDLGISGQTQSFVNLQITSEGATVNGTAYALAPVASFATPNFYLFNTYNAYRPKPRRAWVKSFEVVGKCNLIPCYRKADGEIGMYDTIRKRFFTNAGTTAFGKGADVN